MADNRWNDRNEDRRTDRDWYRDDYDARQMRGDRKASWDWDRQGHDGRNEMRRTTGLEGRSFSPRDYQGTAGVGSFADYGAPSSNGYPSQFGGNAMPGTAWLGTGRGSGGRDAYAADRYGDRYDEAGGYRQPDGYRSFDSMPRGNPYVQDVADGGHADGQHLGEHRGRGPKNYRRSDARILEDVNDRLTDDAWLDAQDIDVEVKDCEVTLSGTVGDRRAKRHAENLVERVSGVTHVQNNLRVRDRDSRDQYEPVIPTTE